MPLMELDARVSSGTLIAWEYDAENEDHHIRITDDDGMWSLHPRNTREAIEMFQHTYAYEWTLDALDPADYIYDVDRGELVPR